MAIETQSRMRGILDALQIRREESGRTGLLFLYLFFASVVFTAGRTARDTLFLNNYPSPQKWLPYMWVGYGAASATIVPIYSLLNDRFRRDIFNASFSLFLALTYVLSWLFVVRHWVPIYPILFIWVEVTSNFLIVQFWTLANDLHDPREAKRLFGVIGSSRMIGIVFCGFAVSALVGAIGTPALLLTNAMVLVIISFLVTRIGKRYIKPALVARVISSMPEKSAAPPASIWKSKYVLLIVVMIAATYIAATIGDYQFKIIARQHYTGEKLAAFFALFYMAVGTAAFFFHFFVSSRLLARFGVIFGLLVMPLLMGFSGIWLILSGGALLAASSLKLSDNAFQFTINDASLNLLYYPFPAGQKARIKAAMEGAIKPISYGLGGIVLIFLAMKLGPVKLSYITLPIVAAWVVVLFTLRGHYVKALLNSLANRHIEPGDISITATPEVINELANAARSDNDYLFEFALGELEKLDPSEARKVLEELVRNPARSSAALMKLAEIGADAAMVKPYLGDPDVQIRAAAVWALASALEEDSIDDLAPFLKSPNTVEADAACAALICHAELDGVLAAGEFLRRLLEGDEAARVRAARILGRAGVQEFYRPVKRLLKDSSLDVRREAVRSAGLLRNSRLLDDLIAALGDPSLRPLVIEAIENFGGRALDKLSLTLVDEKFPLDTRERIPRLIRKINRPEAVSALWEHAGTSDERLRVPILHHGERLQEKWSLSIDHGRVRGLLSAEGVTAARWFQRWKNLKPLAGDMLLAEALERSLYWSGRRVFSLLRFLYGPNEIGRIRYNLESGNQALRASALETLDNMLPTEEREWIVPLMDSGNRAQVAGTLPGRFPESRESPEETMKSLVGGGYYYLTAVIVRARERVGAKFTSDEIASLADIPDDLVTGELIAIVIRSGHDIGAIEKIANERNSPRLHSFVKYATEQKKCLETMPKEECVMLTNLERVIFLKKVPLFAGVPGEDLARIAKEIVIETFTPGQEIFKAGDIGAEMYIIVEGRVSVHLDKKELVQLAKEDFFGEMSLLDQEARSATVTAVEPVVALKISREDFLEMMADRPDIARAVLATLSRRLRKADTEIHKLSSPDRSS